MPPISVKSSTTIRTVDDVFSQLEIDLDPDASLVDTRERIRRITRNDPTLQSESIDSLQSVVAIFSPVILNSTALVKSMFRYSALLGGVQATSFFYPICAFSDAPWDFYCSSKESRGDKFVNEIMQFGGLDLIEDITSTNGNRVVYFRRVVSGDTAPLNIRIYVSEEDPLTSVLGFEKSYQQSFISATAAICFWPRLNRKGLYRVFKSNSGEYNYPVGKTVLRVNVKKMSKTSPKVPQTVPSIYTGISERVEAVMFKNECEVDNKTLRKTAIKLENIVYAVSQHSTRYLGDIAEM